MSEPISFFQQFINAVNAHLAANSGLATKAADWFFSDGLEIAINLVTAAILLVAGRYVIRYMVKAIHLAAFRAYTGDRLFPLFLESAVKKALWAVLLLFILQHVGVDVGPLVAGVGVTGIVIGFACQESLSNLAAGVMVAINQPFRVGDFVELGAYQGSVHELNMMAATLITVDNKRIVIPNKVVWSSAITNFTANRTRRLELKIGISYSSSIDQAEAVARGVFAADAAVLKDPEPIIGVVAMGSSSMDMVFRAWVKTDDYWPTYFRLMKEMKAAFDANAIEIPFPKLDLYLKEGIKEA